MKPMLNDNSIIRRACGGESGQAFTILMLGMAGLLVFGMVTLAVDFGSLLQVRRELQASTDAAALAAAQDLPISDSQAIAKANEYSGISGGKNAKAAHPATMVAGYPQTKCLTSIGVPCAPTSNAIVVKQKAVAPLVFGKVIGLNAINVTAISTASAKGAGPLPLDIAIVVDITGSMTDNCTASVPGVSGPDKLDCAKAGMRALLTSLWPCHPSRGNCGAASGGQVTDPFDSIALLAFPGLKQSSRVPRHYDCSNNLSCTSVPTSCDYDRFADGPIYTVVPLASNYKTTAEGSLNGSSSNLVKSIGWSDGAGCSSSHYGLEPVTSQGGSIGTFFADAITEAKNLLVNTGRPGIQKAIIFLSDGDANSYSGMGSNQCQRAITAAQSAKTAGIWVYSIAYEASSSKSNSCNTDSQLSALMTMQQIASDSSKFYNQPYPGDLTEIFKRIAVDMSTVRLIPENTL